MFYPLIAETEMGNKGLEDQYKHRATNIKCFILSFVETETVNKGLEDHYKHRATNIKCFILSLQRQRLMW